MESRDEYSFDFMTESGYRFLEQMDDHSADEIEALTETMLPSHLALNMEAVDSFLNYYHFEKRLISDNFLRLLSEAMTEKMLHSVPVLLFHVRNIVRILTASYPDRVVFLLRETRFTQRLLEITGEVSSCGCATFCMSPLSGNTINVCSVISEFIPNQWIPGDGDWMSSSCREMVLSGVKLNRMSDEHLRLADYAMDELYRRVFEVCRTVPQCLVHYNVLLMKMAHWSLTDNRHFGRHLISKENLIEMTGITIASTDENKVKVGFWLAHILVCLDQKSLLMEKFHLTLAEVMPRVYRLLKSGEFVWIEEVYASLVVHGASNVHLTSKLPADVEIKMRVFEICNVCDSILSLSSMHSKNCEKVASVLKSIGAPTISAVHGPDRESTTEEWRKRFSTQVTDVVKTLDAMQVERGYFDYVPDMFDEEYFSDKPGRPDEIRLAKAFSWSLLRAIGASRSPSELETNSFVKVLRYLSILHAVNENWRIMYDLSDPTPLVPRSLFISSILTRFVQTKMEEKHTKKLCMLGKRPCKIARQHPFLLPISARIFIFKLRAWEKLQDIANKKTLKHLVSREGPLEYVAKRINILRDSRGSRWEFQFEEELAIGLGPTKEFYTEFSRECQRHDLCVWIGEPGEEIDGKRYTTSEHGLFPSPETVPDSKTEHYLIAMGTMMAKSLLDNVQMDLNFCDSLYSATFRSFFGSQQLTVHDLRYVMPGAYRFLILVMEAQGDKKLILSDQNLSAENKAEAISRITCGGCSFEDLCTDFTVPGFPSIEMVPGGRDIFLSVENILQYVRLVIWWLLYEGPMKKFGLITQGFAEMAPIKCLRMFYPHEFKTLFSGTDDESWTPEILERCCSLENGLTVNTPVVKYLFEVLSSLNSEERKGFLRFVTCTPKLPVGGFDGLRPRLTVCLQNLNGNPDGCLPTARTCFNALVISHYSSKEVLREKLMFATVEGAGRFEFV